MVSERRKYKWFTRNIFLTISAWFDSSRAGKQLSLTHSLTLTQDLLKPRNNSRPNSPWQRNLYWRRIIRLGRASAKNGSSSKYPSVYKYGQADGSSVLTSYPRWFVLQDGLLR